MTANISSLADVHPQAKLADDVEVGPFCVVGPHVTIGAGTRLESHVSITGHTTLGRNNRLFPGAVLGTPPQDVSWKETDTLLEIGDDNLFREGVTVNVGAEKEDRTTRIGNHNMFMSNSHIAHNCHIHNHVILVNGVLLGGHVHVHDRAIVSGNSVVHHFSTLGTLSFVSGGCRVPHDIPPFMLAAGSDNPTLKTINVVGLRRAGISDETIRAVKQAFKLLYRQHRKVEDVRTELGGDTGEALPAEVATLLNFVEAQRLGHMGRAREAVRKIPQPDKATIGGTPTEETERRAA